MRREDSESRRDAQDGARGEERERSDVEHGAAEEQVPEIGWIP